MKNWIKENKLMAGVLGFIIVILLIAAKVFLFTADEGGITGAQTIKQLGASFWGWLVFASAISGVGTYYLVRMLKKNGGVGVSYGFIIAILLPLLIVFGKACEGKADGGVTTPKGRPDSIQIDTNRIPAEDLIKK